MHTSSAGKPAANSNNPSIKVASSSSVTNSNSSSKWEEYVRVAKDNLERHVVRRTDYLSVESVEPTMPRFSKPLFGTSAATTKEEHDGDEEEEMIVVTFRNQMKSLPARGGIAGNLKMKGKRTRVLSCKCCVALNFKLSERVKAALKEIKTELM